MDRETGQCFGLVEGLETELGYFDLTELAETTVLRRRSRRGTRPLLAAHDPGRDQGAGPGPLARGALQKPAKPKGTFTPADVVSAEEFLFGVA